MDGEAWLSDNPRKVETSEEEKEEKTRYQMLASHHSDQGSIPGAPSKIRNQ